MATVNKVHLLGTLTRDPEVRYTAANKAVCELGLALNKTWFDKQANERKTKTVWVDVTLWGRTAEIAGEYLQKGKQVYIEGELDLDQWEDKQTGQRRQKLKVVGQEMQLVGNRRSDDQTPANERQWGEQSQVGPEDNGSQASGGGAPDEDVPFAPVEAY